MKIFFRDLFPKFLFRHLLFSAMILLSAFAGAHCWPAIAAESQLRISEPVPWATEIMQTLGSKNRADAINIIARAIKKDNFVPTMIKSMSAIELSDNPILKLALDRNYNDSIRVLIFYQFNDSTNTPFVYYRFVFKAADSGWVLSNFLFATENGEPFPKDMLPR